MPTSRSQPLPVRRERVTPRQTKARGLPLSAEALAAIEATLPDGREAELSQDVRDLIHRKVEDWDVNNEILRHSGDRDLDERYRAGQRMVRHSTLTIFCGPLRVFAMLARDVSGKAHRKFAASSAIEAGLSQINDPKQGARLIRAFLRITDPRVRLAIVQMVEKVGSASADC
jgi:hypothetical protein